MKALLGTLVLLVAVPALPAEFEPARKCALAAGMPIKPLFAFLGARDKAFGFYIEWQGKLFFELTDRPLYGDGWRAVVLSMSPAIPHTDAQWLKGKVVLFGVKDGRIVKQDPAPYESETGIHEQNSDYFFTLAHETQVDAGAWKALNTAVVKAINATAAQWTSHRDRVDFIERDGPQLLTFAKSLAVCDGVAQLSAEVLERRKALELLATRRPSVLGPLGPTKRQQALH